jgi:C1A family cysteine protease
MSQTIRTSLSMVGIFLLSSTIFSVSDTFAQTKETTVPKVSISKEQRTKLLKLDEELREEAGKTAAKALPETKRKLPDATAASFDWVQQLGGTPIHKQDGKPSCVAQAVVGALEWNWQIRNGTKTKPILSPQPILDRLNKGGNLVYRDALNQLLLHGTASIVLYPYTGEPEPVKKINMPFRIIGWGQIGTSGKATPEMIKKALLENGPLVASMYSTPAFRGYKGGIFAEHNQSFPKDDPTNHAILILGWDDKKGKNGCWHIQNSWGLKWGEAGGAWIEYGCNNVGYSAFWVKSQGLQYNLPEDAHKILGNDATPFPKWPNIKDSATKE